MLCEVLSLVAVAIDEKHGLGEDAFLGQLIEDAAIRTTRRRESICLDIYCNRFPNPLVVDFHSSLVNCNPFRFVSGGL